MLLRLRLGCGAAILALLAFPLAAQAAHAKPGPADAPQPAAAPAGPSPDGLDPDSFYLEADQVSQDDDSKTATAQGHVELRYRGRTLRAQSLTYKSDTGAVSAKGDVVVINEDGTAEFAKELELDKDLKAGVALAFSARLQHNVKIAADSLIRRQADVTELNRAIYTPCDICTKDGAPKKPSWSIQAEKAVEDKAHHVIYYRHAVIRVLGVPVFYTPVFWNPDTDTQARTGFLAPQLNLSKRRGFSYEQPYLIAVSPSQDIVISPIISSKVNPFLNLDFRKRFYSGSIDARFGYTYEREFDNNGNPIAGSPLTSRSYVLAKGEFNLSDKWLWGFSGERVTDDLLFDRYDIRGVYERRGLFETDSRRLLSQIYAVRQDQTSYLSISALTFQGLRIDDVNSGMPVVAPLIEGRFEPDTEILGGRLRAVGSAVLLNRDSALTDPTVPGIDSHRATAEVDWRRAFTFTNGLRVEPFGSGRLDYYSVTDLPASVNISKSSSRAIGTVGMDLTYPLIRYTSGASIVLEPIAEGIYSARAKPDPDIPNTDSADFVFDETNLFDANRTPGFDLYDSGARLNLGGRATVNWGEGRWAHAFIGRSFRSAPDLTLPNRSGYGARTSDWILAAQAAPIKGLWVYERTQLDGSTLQLRRQEAGFNMTLPFFRGYARYLHDYSDPSGERENVDAAGDIFLTKHWGVVLYGSRDIVNGVWARRDIGVLYEDECTRLELVYHHEAAFSRLGGPSDSVQVRLTLATLGEQGYREQSRR
jgi:LPS-assembly protein